jgi:hypothetical protein
MNQINYYYNQKKAFFLFLISFVALLNDMHCFYLHTLIPFPLLCIYYCIIHIGSVSHSSTSILFTWNFMFCFTSSQFLFTFPLFILISCFHSIHVIQIHHANSCLHSKRVCVNEIIPHFNLFHSHFC